MSAPDRVVLDEMGTPNRPAALVAYRDHGAALVGIDRVGSGSMGAIGTERGADR